MAPKSVISNLPIVFVGSSGKSLPIARSVREALADVAQVNIWETAFNPGTWTLGAILEFSRSSDFGVFVVAPDDDLTTGGNELTAVRDNVLFEIGVFMGALGPERTFVLWPAALDKMRLPSDLEGLTRVNYTWSPDGEFTELAVELSSTRQSIATMGSALRSGYNEVATLKKTLDEREQRFRKHPAESFKEIVGTAAAQRLRPWFPMTEVRELTGRLEDVYDDTVIDTVFWWLIVYGVITFDNIDYWNEGTWHWSGSVDHTQFTDRGVVLLNELRNEYQAHASSLMREDKRKPRKGR